MSAQDSNNQEGTRQEIESLPPGLNYLKGLEELMKCPICFDYLQAPMLLPNCDHNYCSLCIRKYLTLKEQCPACGCKASSNLLRSNQIFAKVIKQFKTIA
ncbi:hypothetical protein V1264_024551 [Littorina saxatilis]|uniref:RING-type E3 ubiquitin transferase n=2 Tax=Littorina saxatilis TaxID=31220 RepID=A0AAN9FY72_9CAEN